ncbi:MAG: DUF1553 domain-containing protein, partial [Acidobacteriaceae bacterium]|nr:DUF1553 domain-containing protein [Acidobacteriaceae bacterium]
APRKNGAAVVPGKPDESLLIKRIFSDDPAFRMPPVFAHKTLTQDQKEILRRWIEQGATWKQHWAFIPPVKPAEPEVKDAKWARNAIDRFILAKLEANNLQPAPEADRRTLIRRVTLDLTGLPPTPEEVDAFLKDQSPNAYERLVDRLLQSPHYGEHRGRYWLDAARYADTQGLHIDNYREMWPYRDWVINAFNRNMPFNQFTIEQLGGDLLPKPTLDQQIASGFHRCNVTTNEGGVIPAEYEAIYAKDRADTTGAVWLGLTVGCATCHDHKFDPIKQKEFYALTSFFRNTTQNAMDGNIQDTPPTVLVPPPSDRKRWEELKTLRANVQELIDKSASDAEFDKWLETPKDSAKLDTIAPSSRALYLQVDKDVKVLRHEQAEPLSLGENVTIAEGATESMKALCFDKDGFVTLPNMSEMDADKPFTVAAWIYLPKQKESRVIASQIESAGGGKNADGSEKRRGWVMAIDAGTLGVSGQAPSIRLVSDDGKAISARPIQDFELKPETWYHISFTYDGSRDRRGLALYVNGKLVPTYGSGLDDQILPSSIHSTSPLKLGADRKGSFTGGRIADFRLLNRHMDETDAELFYWESIAEPAAGKTPTELAAQEREAMRHYYAYAVNPSVQKSVAQLHQIHAERSAIARRSAVTFVMQERTDSQPVAHVLYRGQYDALREEVHPTVPAVLPPMTQSMPRNRLGLAQWLVDPANPLTARVTVNRFWQEVFGTGIVKTVEDFGSQGEPPSHPELLDWMAIEFRDSGWDIKKLFRLMVTSATYRQSAAATPEKLEKDRDNRLLSRGPRFRMDGEVVRDYALAVSGLLNPTIGGPSVKPYQPANIWETVAMDVSNTRFYKRDSGDKLYRRSMYTFWKRSAPPASMDIFNAPSRETCTVRRERTNTPLQALVTMNDVQFVEAARRLAQNALLSSRKGLDQQVNYIADRLMARDLDAKEYGVVAQSYKDYLNYYDSKPEDAAKLLSVGESKADPKLPKAEFAAMTMVANELMNLDEVLVK